VIRVSCVFCMLCEIGESRGQIDSCSYRGAVSMR
jgi:hypothetical protein